MNDNIYKKEDPLFKQVLAYAFLKEEISIAMIQREFNIGYNRAASLFDMLKNVNVIGEKIPNKLNTYKVDYQLTESKPFEEDEELLSIIDEMSKEYIKKERNLDKILHNYYENTYDEETRLLKDKVHHLEFITTTKYIEQYLKKGDRILEVGAGTGAYSLYYAKKGYQVDALELVKANLDIMRKKITKDMKITEVEGNALDLGRYQDDTFDVTLVLGPLYHLFKKSEQEKALEEAIRVTKVGGKILVAFILFDLTMLSWGFQDKNIYENYGDDKQISSDFKPNNSEDLVFNMNYISEIKSLLAKFPVKKLKFVATDGIGRLVKDMINNMTDEEYELYVKYHLSIAEREDLIGYSGHILAILEKE